jgi:uncharacterized protein (DUF885 family)
MSTTARDLADRFQHRWLEVHPFAATSYGIPGYDHLVPDESEAGYASWDSEVESFLAQADAVAGGPVGDADAVTLSCLREALEQERAMLASAAVDHTVTPMPFADPGSYLAVSARTVLVDGDAAEDYLTRLRGIGPWFGQLCERLRAGAAEGRVPVAPLAEQALAWAERVLAEEAPAALLAPQAPADWSGRDAWEAERRRVAAEVAKPALAGWAETVAELLPVARPGDKPGLAHLPGGEEDYRRYIRVHTTLPLTAEQLHQTGLDEVAGLEERAVRIGERLGLRGLEEVMRAVRDSAGRVTPDESVRDAVTAIRRAEAAAPRFFPAPLPAPCEVTPMPSVVAVSGAAPHYTPPRLDGGRPGTFWFNTERPTAGTGWDLEVVAFHEAVPGHHLQLSRVQLLTDLPDLQRQRSLTVFSEGWGLYAEQLAEEMGLYSGDRGLLGAIAASLMRAARLVVDTGLHAYGWSREQAREYMVTHVPMPAEFLAAEIDRYIVMPGQALAYLTGKLEILRLREEARRRLGDAFTLAGFHAAVLDQGSLPLPALEASLARWSGTAR